MLFLVLFLMFCLTISIIINIISIKLNIKAGGIIRSYEEFYEGTIENTVSIIEYFENLLNNNAMLAEDSDVIQIRKSMKMFYDNLVGYMNAIPKNRKESEKN